MTLHIPCKGLSLDFFSKGCESFMEESFALMDFIMSDFLFSLWLLFDLEFNK